MLQIKDLLSSNNLQHLSWLSSHNIFFTVKIICFIKFLMLEKLLFELLNIDDESRCFFTFYF